MWRLWQSLLFTQTFDLKPHLFYFQRLPENLFAPEIAFGLTLSSQSQLLNLLGQITEPAPMFLKLFIVTRKLIAEGKQELQ